MSTLGIVILNYGTPKLTLELLRISLDISLFNKIVIVDNNSVDDSKKIIGDYILNLGDDRVEFLETGENLGYARGNNVGLRYLVDRGIDFCYVANPDTFFEYSTIYEIAALLETDEYGLVTCSRKYKTGNQIRQFWDFPSFTDILMENSFIGSKIKAKKYIYNVNGTKPFEIEVSPGAFFAIKSKVLTLIDYLDSNTFLWYEENCLAAKLRMYGIKIGFIPSVEYIIINDVENSTKKFRKNKKSNSLKISCQSKMYFAKKYLKIGFIKKTILKFSNFIFVVERKIINLFK